MRTKTCFPVVAALLVAVSVSATAAETVSNLPINFGANRISGAWSTVAEVRPCGTSLPFTKVLNTIVLHDGGTVTENPRFPPSGVPNVYGVPGINQRSIGLGTWSYNPSTRRYSISLQFDWFVDGVYNGYQTVDREVTLSSDGESFAGSVESARYGVDGSVIATQCGSAVDERL